MAAIKQSRIKRGMPVKHKAQKSIANYMFINRQLTDLRMFLTLLLLIKIETIAIAIIHGK